jgi:hypothetical protein
MASMYTSIPPIAAAAPFSAVAPASASAPLAAGTSPAVPSRDSSVADLSALTASINLLAQQASGAGVSAQDASAAIAFPSLPAMPAPQQPAAVPTDDHGSSNVVFADPDADGSLIH